MAGVQAAAGIVGRALASAAVEGDGGAVDPHLLEGVGDGPDTRRSVSPGGSPWGPGDGCVFSARAPRRVSPTEIPTRSRGSTGYKKAGHPRRAPCAPWQAKLSTSESTAIHVDRGKASRRSPVRSPAASSPHRLAASLGDEADVVVSRIIPIAQGSGENAANQLTQALTGRLPGRVVWPETQLAGAGAGRSSAPMRDFGATRTGFEAPISGPQLYAHLFSEVCEICGVPGALVESDVGWTGGS